MRFVNPWFDESMISGEAVPVAKQKDSEVVGGTINKNGSLTFRATRVGADTVLAQIIRMVESAQAEKPPIQELADKIAGVFVPIVMIIALVTFVSWFTFGPAPALSFAFVTMVSVLLIACPCAMSSSSVFVLTNSLRLGRFKPNEIPNPVADLKHSLAPQAGLS